MSAQLNNPKAIAEKGEKIYEEHFKKEFEAKHMGKFAAIEVLGGKAFVDELPEGALKTARQEIPNGLFHLIRIGSPGAFRVSYTLSDANVDWFSQ